MPINGFLYPGAKVTPAYDVANSCRFDASSSAYMHKTPSSTGVEEKFTFSFWIKFNSAHSANQCVLFIEGDNGADDYVEIAFKPQLDIQFNNGTYSNYVTNRKFRDPSAWYHIVIAVDTTQSTAGNRLKLYVNGTQETSWATETVITQNDVLQANTSGKKMWLNAHYNGPKNFVDGYLAEVVWIDGTQYAASDFGEFDEDSPTIWKPKDVSGLTFGTNGFYLDFEDSSNLGNDANGGTDLTEVNLAATDQSTDTCTNNFATMNPLNLPTSNQPTFSEGNLKTVTSSSGSGRFGGSTTFGVSQGKWYVEAKATVGSTYSRNCIGVSYNPSEMARNNSDNTLTHVSYAWGWDSSDGKVYHDSSNIVNYASYTTGDICQIFLDLDNHKLYFGKNGTLQSSTGIDLDSGETYFIAQVDRTGTSEVSTFEFNFGSPSYSISSGNTDGEYGNFEYSTTITGDGASKTFKALNSKNLAEFG